MKNNFERRLDDIVKKIEELNFSVVSIFKQRITAKCYIIVKCNVCGEERKVHFDHIDFYSDDIDLNINCKKCIFENKKKKAFKKAKEYNHSIDFKKNSPSEYYFLTEHNLYGEATKHFVKLGNKKKRLIYAYIFEKDGIKSVYIGLTYNMKERHCNGHIKKGTVYEFAKKNKLPIPEPIILTDFLDAEIASRREGEILKEYQNMGYDIINKQKTGGLGGDKKMKYKNMFTYKQLEKISKEYKNRTDWYRKDTKSYKCAEINGWLDELKPIKKSLYINYEDCKRIVDECPVDWKLVDFRKNMKSLYNRIKDKKWYDLIEKFERCGHPLNFTIEDIKEALDKCISIQDFKKKYPRMNSYCNIHYISISDLAPKHYRIACKRSIICYTKDFKFVKKYDNVHEILKDDDKKDFKRDSIYKCCWRIILSYRGYIFRWEDEQIEDILLEPAILSFDLNNNFIKRYTNIDELIQDGLCYRPVKMICENKSNMKYHELHFRFETEEDVNKK